jgi:hypothetical protein
LCCLPIQLESKYYPLAILAIFSVLMGPRFSMIIGLSIGYIEALGYLDRIKLSQNTATVLEKKPFFKQFEANSGIFYIFNSFFRYDKK